MNIFHCLWLCECTVFIDVAEIRCTGDSHPGRSSGWTGGQWQNASRATSCWHHQWWWVNAHATFSLFFFLSLFLQLQSLLIFSAWAWAACTPTGHEPPSLLFLTLLYSQRKLERHRHGHMHGHTHRFLFLHDWISRGGLALLHVLFQVCEIGHYPKSANYFLISFIV